MSPKVCFAETNCHQNRHWQSAGPTYTECERLGLHWMLFLGKHTASITPTKTMRDGYNTEIQ